MEGIQNQYGVFSLLLAYIGGFWLENNRSIVIEQQKSKHKPSLGKNCPILKKTKSLQHDLLCGKEN